MQCEQISDLAMLLRKDGDKILDASSKLSLSASLLSKLNESLASIKPTDTILNDFIDLGFIYDFMQRTLALKLFTDCGDIFDADFLDLKLFHDLRLLEIHRLGLNLVKGLRHLRSQLEYVTCVRSLTTLRDVLENCGGDRTQGYVWGELKEAVFSHNNLTSIDGSLEFAPWLRSLDLSHNHIRNFDNLNCLTNLRYLNLANNKIEALPVFFGQLRNNLEVLILKNNYIEDIKEIESLHSLRELDVSNNCLINFETLLPLTNLPYLQYLNLQDNPISYHGKYRTITASHLHNNTATNDFLLDNLPLSKKELRVVGSFQPTHLTFERSESMNSTITTSTVILYDKAKSTQTAELTSSGDSVEVTQVTKEQSVQTGFRDVCGRCTKLPEQGMHDSGFVAGPRPASPSDSIEPSMPTNPSTSFVPICSASSLQHDANPENTLHYCESDIEILSNPSQSSIEVLSSVQAPRCVRSCITVPHNLKEICSDADLKTVTEELHRSL